MKAALKLPLILIIFFSSLNTINSQILFSESFNEIVDTTHSIKGSIIPNFKFQTQKENLLEFENFADVSFRIGKDNIITIANKIEISKYGSETLLSGGYLYTEYRRILDKKLVIEPYSQIHWADARGMEWKFALGINARQRLIVNEKIHLYTGIGPFYEYERWNFNGVPDEFLPTTFSSPISQKALKLGSYISCKIKPNNTFDFDFSLYHQSKFNEIFSTPRLASSSMFKINITKVLGFNIIHQFIYDYNPIVPIKKEFNKVIVGFSVNF